MLQCIAEYSDRESDTQHAKGFFCKRDLRGSYLKFVASMILSAACYRVLLQVRGVYDTHGSTLQGTFLRGSCIQFVASMLRMVARYRARSKVRGVYNTRGIILQGSFAKNTCRVRASSSWCLIGRAQCSPRSTSPGVPCVCVRMYEYVCVCVCV